jgi:LmbE family N-acetylglucosaminyl deacetylase
MPTDAEIPASALAVYAHPDDPEISAGGTLASWAAAGADVSVLITTRGDKGTQDPDADLGELARLRVEETAKAAALLGFTGHFHLGYHDGELPDDQELREAITRYVRELRPQVVLCPDPTAVFFGDRYYNHHDHRVTGWATLDAVAPAAGNPHYFAEHLAEGLEVHHVQACTSRARWSRTPGSTSATRSSARSTRSSATPVNSPRRASGSGSSCGTGPKRPDAKPAWPMPRDSAA